MKPEYREAATFSYVTLTSGKQMLVLELRGCVLGSRALFLNAIKRKSEMSKKCRRNSNEKLLDTKNVF